MLCYLIPHQTADASLTQTLIRGACPAELLLSISPSAHLLLSSKARWDTGSPRDQPHPADGDRSPRWRNATGVEKGVARQRGERVLLFLQASTRNNSLSGNDIQGRGKNKVRLSQRPHPAASAECAKQGGDFPRLNWGRAVRADLAASGPQG